MKRESISAVYCCEYSKNKKVAAARAMFFNGSKHIMVVTERWHFYKRLAHKFFCNRIQFQNQLSETMASNTGWFIIVQFLTGHSDIENWICMLRANNMWDKCFRQVPTPWCATSGVLPATAIPETVRRIQQHVAAVRHCSARSTDFVYGSLQQIRYSKVRFEIHYDVKPIRCNSFTNTIICRLCGMVGAERAAQMLASDRQIHIITNE